MPAKPMSKTALLNAVITLLSDYVPDLAGAAVAYDRKTRAYATTLSCTTIHAPYGEMLIWLGCVALTGRVMPLDGFDEAVEIAVRESLAVRA